MKYSLLLLLFAPILALANPDEKPPLSGVWTGTIGTQAITACFNAGRYQKDTGNYYYQRYLRPIFLKSTDIGSGGTGTEWKENDGEWHMVLDEQHSDAVSGAWTSPDKSRTLPITLAKVKEFNGEPVKDTDGCWNAAYLEAIKPSPKTLLGPEQVINGVKYRKVSMNIETPGEPCDTGRRCMETIEIIGDTLAIQSINRQLQETAPVDFDDLLSCWQTSVLEGYYNLERIQTVNVSVIGPYLMLQIGNHSTCITMRPIGVWNSTYIWNLKIGEREDLFSWFQDDEESTQGTLEEFVQGDEESTQSTLAKFVYDRIWIDDLEYDLLQCYGDFDLSPDDYMYGDSEYGDRYRYQLVLSNSGIRFEVPARSNGSCGGREVFTFEELWPFLNEYGKAAVAQIRKSGAAKKR
ncbi:MAG: hypothetical protein LBS49_02525 [Candidatus Accumulibacter sp.]|jgi:hypothetical protein|nr:hypothetical protein [Accumulibacter sp.]